MGVCLRQSSAVSSCSQPGELQATGCLRAAGHNADDIAETVLLNILRGDVPRLGRCASIITGEEGALPRVKPFKYTYEKEIVMYAFFKKLDYFSTECIYSPFAARGAAREFVKDLEVSPSPYLPGKAFSMRTMMPEAYLWHGERLQGLEQDV